MTQTDGPKPGNQALVRKFAVTAATGAATFIASAMLDNNFNVPLPDQLILSTIVGAVTLMAQLLIDFDGRLDRLEGDTRKRLDAMEARQESVSEQARKDMNEQFERISSATRFFTLIEKSALRTDSLIKLVDRSGQINGTSPPLFRDLAHHEIERLSALIRALSIGHEVFYDGEDREWLLGLAHRVSASICATSLATVDAGSEGFEGGLWMNDLGNRYLDVQRDAVRRGVEIKRIFVFDKPEFEFDVNFTRIRQLQRDAGVQVRMLDSSTVPEHLKSKVFDFVLFDGVISYETDLATRMESGINPSVVTTRLILDEARVRQRAERFEELWAAARESDRPRPPLQVAPDR
jgi:hypothetical protein